MRTTVEITDEQRAELVRLAARRGEKGFSAIVQEALDLYLKSHSGANARTRAALAALGSLSEPAAARLAETVQQLRTSWR